MSHSSLSTETVHDKTLLFDRPRETVRQKYCTPLPNNTVITIGLELREHPKRYSINFLNAKRDRAVHINVRFDQDAIVFNTQAGQEWLAEERTDMFDFVRSQFSKVSRVCLLLKDRELKFAINRNHLYKFKYGQPLESLVDLLIEGDVRVYFINYSIKDNRIPLPLSNTSLEKTIFQPFVPFYYDFQNSIKPNAKFIISGFPRSCRTPVVINLEENENRIHFHISIRMHEKRIVRNTYAGEWQKEEDHLFEFPFDLGNSFDMEIKVFAESFETKVNGEPCFRFHQRIKPLETIKRLKIVGPVQLYAFRYEE